MKPSHSKNLRTLSAWFLLFSLTVAGSALDAAAQATFGRKPPGLKGSSQHLHPPDSRPVPSSVPTWSLPDPLYNDPDLFTNRESHSAVYDPGTNEMIVFGGGRWESGNAK